MKGTRKLPAARGLAWFSGSISLLRAQPVRLLLIGLVLQFLMGFSQFGLVGVLMLLAIPALTAGVLQSMTLADRGYRPPLMTLFSAFSDTARLLRLFILGAVSGIVALLTAGVIMSGSLEAMSPEILSRLEQGDVQALVGVDPELVQRLALGVLTGLLVSGSIAYFAIPLIWFQGRPVGVAISEGLVGMIRNWAPVLVMGLLLAIVAMPVALATVAMMAASYGAGQASPLLTLIMLLMMVAFQMLLFGAQYHASREIFGIGMGESGPDNPEEGDNQLVA